MDTAHGIPGEVEAREALATMMQDKGLSLADVAGAIGISRSAVSQWRSGVYKGDREALTAKVRSFLGLQTQRAAAPRAGGFVRTSLAAEVLAVCQYAHVNRDIGLVYGEPGTGKTYALKHYASQHPDVVYVKCDPSFGTPQAMLERLLEKLGQKARTNDLLHRMVRETSNVLSGSGRLVVIDEAQFLGVKGLEVLRAIHDEAEIGLVLAGNLEVYTRLHGDGKAEFAQLFSRVGIRRHLRLAVPETDVAAIVGEVPPDCLRFLHDRANERGGLRRMDKILRLARTLASDEALERRHLLLADAMQVGPKGAAA